MINQKCNKLEVKINLHEQKQIYKQTHIPADFLLL